MSTANVLRELRQLRAEHAELVRLVGVLVERGGQALPDELTTAEAERYGVPRRTLVRLAAEGRLSELRRGRLRLWLRRELDQYLRGDLVAVRRAS